MDLVGVNQSYCKQPIVTYIFISVQLYDIPFRVFNFIQTKSVGFLHYIVREIVLLPYVTVPALSGIIHRVYKCVLSPCNCPVTVLSLFGAITLFINLCCHDVTIEALSAIITLFLNLCFHLSTILALL